MLKGKGIVLLKKRGFFKIKENYALKKWRRCGKQRGNYVRRMKIEIYEGIV